MAELFDNENISNEVFMDETFYWDAIFEENEPNVSDSSSSCDNDNENSNSIQTFIVFLIFRHIL